MSEKNGHYRTPSHKPLPSKKTLSMFENGIQAATEIGAREFVEWVKHHPYKFTSTKVEIQELFTEFLTEKDQAQGRGL